MRHIWVIATAAIAVACSGDDALRRGDNALANDLALASQVQQPATTAFHDTVVAPVVTRPPAHHVGASAPGAKIQQPPRPSPPPALTQASAPGPVVQPVVAPLLAFAPIIIPAPLRVIAVGTTMAATATSRVCTTLSHPGDRVVATVNLPVIGTNGATIPAGSSVVIEVLFVDPNGASDSAQIGFRIRSVVINDAIYSAAGTVSQLGPLERVRRAGRAPDDKSEIIGGAIAGAIIGQILGKDTKSTVVGAAAGAATGGAVAAATRSQDYESCMPKGAQLTLTLVRAITM